MTKQPQTSGNALDLLEEEDLKLRQLFSRMRLKQGSSVEERADYGDTAKATIRHLATREAALVELTKATEHDSGLQGIAQRFERSMHEHRPHIDRVEQMSRGVQGINLRVGQDFDGEMQNLMQIIGTEIEWEASEALPAIKGSPSRPQLDDELKSARHVAKHAPTNLDPAGPRWRERAPVVSRIITLYDRLRDFPRGSGGQRPRSRTQA